MAMANTAMANMATVNMATVNTATVNMAMADMEMKKRPIGTILTPGRKMNKNQINTSRQTS